MTATLVATPDPDDATSGDPHADPDMLRRAPEAPCIHYWRAVDRDESLFVCRWCRATWSLDDDPEDAA